MSEELTNRLARHLRILESARRHDDGTMCVWPEDVDVVAEAVTALSNPAAADSNASAEAITDDQITYANELAEDRRREWGNASAEARLREALEKVRSYNVDIAAGRINYRPHDHIQVIDKALSPDPHASDCDRFKRFAPDGELGKPKKAFSETFSAETVIKEAFFPHASDCEKQGETTKSEGCGQVAPAKCSAIGVHPTDTSCAAEPEVAPGPSDRPADVTDVTNVIYEALPSFNWDECEKAGRALLDAFTVGRR